MKRYFSGLLLVFAFFTFNSFAQNQIDSESLEKHVTILASDEMEGRGFGSNEMARNYILEQFKAAGLEPVNGSYIDTFSVRISAVRVEGKNVMGLIPGSDPMLKNEYIVLGAHYDHMGYTLKDGVKTVFNGADDNASGVASIIEIGKVLMQNRSNLKRSVIIVAFDGEESGLLGSKAFVDDSIVSLSDIKLMLSLDMVGMYEAHKGVDMLGIGSLDGGDELLDKAKGDVTITKRGKAIEQRTDTSPFGKIGIPAIHVFTNTESPYHKPEDDSDLLDYEGMAEICNMVIRFTYEVDKAEGLSPIESLSAEAEKPEIKKVIPGFRINLGSGYHTYKDEFYKAKSNLALETGIFTQIRLANHWRIQPEVVYELKASEYVTGNFMMHAVTVPVNLMLTTGDPVGYQPMGYISVGGFYSYNFSGAIDGDEIDLENVFEPVEYGFTYGIGVHFQKIQMGFYSKYGLSSISQVNNDDIRYNSTYFLFGYTF